MVTHFQRVSYETQGAECVSLRDPHPNCLTSMSGVHSPNAIVLLLISTAFLSTSCLTANQLWQAGFHLAHLSSSVCVACPHPCCFCFFSNNSGQSADSCSTEGGGQWKRLAGISATGQRTADVGVCWWVRCWIFASVAPPVKTYFPEYRV